MSENLRVGIKRDVFTSDHLRVNLISRIKANIYQNHLYTNLFKNVSLYTAISKTSQEQEQHIKKAPLQKDFVDSYTEIFGEKHRDVKRIQKEEIFSPSDEILQRSEREMKAVHQKDDKNKAIILR